MCFDFKVASWLDLYHLYKLKLLTYSWTHSRIQWTGARQYQ